MSAAKTKKEKKQQAEETKALTTLKDEVMSLAVPQVADLPTIIDCMVVFDEDKQEVLTLDEEDKKELATLFYVKGGMSGLTKQSKEMEDKVKNMGAPWMLARGIKTVKVPGIGTFTLVEGENVSISQDNLRKVLVNYVPAAKVQEIIDKVIKKTQYVTLQFKKG